MMMKRTLALLYLLYFFGTYATFSFVESVEAVYGFPRPSSSAGLSHKDLLHTCYDKLDVKFITHLFVLKI